MAKKRGVRFAFITLIVLACIAGGWFQIDRGQVLQGTYENTAREHADDYRDRATKEIFNSCYSGPANVRQACIDKANDTARAQERQEYDLEAQRITAAWTAAMGNAAIIGMMVSIVGVGLVFVTFRETRRSADAAHDANRPWIQGIISTERPRDLQDPLELNLTSEGIGVEVHVNLLNHGNSPAANVFVRAKLVAIPIGADRPDKLVFREIETVLKKMEAREKPRGKVVYPDQPETQGTTDRLAAERIRSIGGAFELRLVLGVSYRYGEKVGRAVKSYRLHPRENVIPVPYEMAENHSVLVSQHMIKITDGPGEGYAT